MFVGYVIGRLFNGKLRNILLIVEAAVMAKILWSISRTDEDSTCSDVFEEDKFKLPSEDYKATGISALLIFVDALNNWFIAPKMAPRPDVAVLIEEEEAADVTAPEESDDDATTTDDDESSSIFSSDNAVKIGAIIAIAIVVVVVAIALMIRK